jgi:hypothetical protein
MRLGMKSQGPTKCFLNAKIHGAVLMSGEFNYYTLLGITPKATLVEIKSAYRAAISKYHPDVNAAPNAENLTAILNEAWGVLNDSTKKAQYDAGLEAKSQGSLGPPTGGVQKGAPVGPPLAMLVCEKCGEEDVHQRFVVFQRVATFIIFTYITTTAMRLCTNCRSREAWSSALFTAFFGFWSIPWGVLNSIKALYIAIKGGSMDKRSNAAMLGYLANAYAQRRNNDAAITALAACNRFQRNKAISDAAESFQKIGAKVLDEPERLDGQMYALCAAVIPVILYAAVYTVLHLTWLHWAAAHYAEIRHVNASWVHLMKQLHLHL